MMNKSLKEVESARALIAEYDRDQNKEFERLMQELEKAHSLREDDGITAEERECIFCGGGTIINGHERRRAGVTEFMGFSVECIKCHAEGPYKQTKREAVDAWNSRKK